jgi:hypothetical protein
MDLLSRALAHAAAAGNETLWSLVKLDIAERARRTGALDEARRHLAGVHHVASPQRNHPVLFLASLESARLEHARQDAHAAARELDHAQAVLDAVDAFLVSRNARLPQDRWYCARFWPMLSTAREALAESLETAGRRAPPASLLERDAATLREFKR